MPLCFLTGEMWNIDSLHSAIFDDKYLREVLHSREEGGNDLYITCDYCLIFINIYVFKNDKKPTENWHCQKIWISWILINLRKGLRSVTCFRVLSWFIHFCNLCTLQKKKKPQKKPTFWIFQKMCSVKYIHTKIIVILQKVCPQKTLCGTN